MGSESRMPLSDSALFERLCSEVSRGGRVGVSSSCEDFMGESSFERRPGDEKMQLSAVESGVSGFLVGVLACDFGGVVATSLVAAACCWLFPEMKSSSICSIHC